MSGCLGPLPKGHKLGTGNLMLFGSAIFIFTLFNITVLFMFNVLWPSCDTEKHFVSMFVRSTWTKSLVRFSGFSPPLAFFTKCETFIQDFFLSTSDVLTTSFLDTFQARTDTRTNLSWTWVCWHGLIIYHLCRCTCPNSNIVLTICFTFDCLISPLLLDADLLFVK